VKPGLVEFVAALKKLDAHYDFCGGRDILATARLGSFLASLLHHEPAARLPSCGWFCGLPECNPTSVGNAIDNSIKAHGQLGHVFQMHQPQKPCSGAEADDYASGRPRIRQLLQEVDFLFG
jgi:hypothetical protein